MDYTKCINNNGKNYAAIEKIIARKSYRDYKSTLAKYPKRKRFTGYSLAGDTLEAIEIKHDYIAGKITEEEYKAYCLKENLVSE